MNRRQFGYKGEAIAAHFLQSKGMRIIENNFTVRGGEIDLILEDNEALVFAEVKSRSEDQSFGGGIESMNYRKFRSMRRAMGRYMQNQSGRELQQNSEHGEREGEAPVPRNQRDWRGRREPLY